MGTLRGVRGRGRGVGDYTSLNRPYRVLIMGIRPPTPPPPYAPKGPCDTTTILILCSSRSPVPAARERLGPRCRGRALIIEIRCYDRNSLSKRCYYRNSLSKRCYDRNSLTKRCYYRSSLSERCYDRNSLTKSHALQDVFEFGFGCRAPSLLDGFAAPSRADVCFRAS